MPNNSLISSINHFVTASSKASANVFVTLYNLLNTYGDVIGVRKIAFSTGTHGKGMDFPNSVNELGNNSWACFFFSRADSPFFMLLQYATSSFADYPFGNETDGAQGTLLGNSSYVSNGGVGAQFAALPYAINRDPDIWAGSRFNVGSDKKLSPCPWVTSSGLVVVYPRANNDVIATDSPYSMGGNNPLSRSMYTCLVSQNEISSKSLMWHTLADANNIIFLKSYGSSSASNAYSAMYFGRYNEAVGFNSQLKYVLLNHVTGTSDPPFSLLSSGSSFYGDHDGSSSLDGGVAHPNASSGCFAAALDLPPFISASKFQPCALFNSNTVGPIFDEFPWALAAYDPSAKIHGYVGNISGFMRAVYGVSTHHLFSSSNRAAFGNAVSTSVKLTVPWPASPPGFVQVPGYDMSLTGTQVFFDATY